MERSTRSGEIETPYSQALGALPLPNISAFTRVFDALWGDGWGEGVTCRAVGGITRQQFRLPGARPHPRLRPPPPVRPLPRPPRALRLHRDPPPRRQDRGVHPR